MRGGYRGISAQGCDAKPRRAGKPALRPPYPQSPPESESGAVAVAGLADWAPGGGVPGPHGCRTLLLVDFDVVEPSNLNRQHYDMRHLGRYKTEALQEQLLQINPYLTVEIQTVRVTPGNAVSLFSGFPIVCEAFDNPAQKRI